MDDHQASNLIAAVRAVASGLGDLRDRLDKINLHLEQIHSALHDIDLTLTTDTE